MDGRSRVESYVSHSPQLTTKVLEVEPIPRRNLQTVVLNGSSLLPGKGDHFNLASSDEVGDGAAELELWPHVHNHIWKGHDFFRLGDSGLEFRWSWLFLRDLNVGKGLGCWCGGRGLSHVFIDHVNLGNQPINLGPNLGIRTNRSWDRNLI